MSYDDLNLPAIAELQADTGSDNIRVDVTGVPPKQYLPKALHKLLDARDAAFSAFVDMESEYVELLSATWERTYAAKDEAAGNAAATAGKDPLSVPSALEEARAQRPRVIGAVKALAAAVRKADGALASAVRRELPAIAEAIETEVAATAAEYVAKQQEADAARQRYGAQLTRRSWVTDWSALGLRTDCPDMPEATPVDASGQEVQDIYHRPVDRGAAEVAAIDASYGRIQARPKVTIRSLTNGQVLEIDPSHAQAMVDKGQAEYVTDADAA